MKALTHDTHQKHKEYIQSLKKEKRLVWLYQGLIFLVFFGAWEAASRQSWVDPLIFSSPSKIWNLFLQKLWDGSLITNLSVTLGETVIGFILGTLLGTLLAALLWWSPFLSKVLDPYLVILNAMPKVALGPIFIVGLGPGFTSIIAMGTIISVIITTIVVYTSFREVDPNYLKVMHTFGAKRRPHVQGSDPPFLVPDHHLDPEGERRTLMGGRHRGRIPRIGQRTWLYDHLWIPGVQLHPCPHVPSRDRHLCHPHVQGRGTHREEAYPFVTFFSANSMTESFMMKLNDGSSCILVQSPFHRKIPSVSR